MPQKTVGNIEVSGVCGALGHLVRAAIGTPCVVLGWPWRFEGLHLSKCLAYASLHGPHWISHFMEEVWRSCTMNVWHTPMQLLAVVSVCPGSYRWWKITSRHSPKQTWAGHGPPCKWLHTFVSEVALWQRMKAFLWVFLQTVQQHWGTGWELPLDWSGGFTESHLQGVVTVEKWHQPDSERTTA